MGDTPLIFDPVEHRYSVNGIEWPSVTRILKDCGVINTDWYTEEARKRGRTVHAAIQYLIDGDLDWNSLDTRIRPYVDAFMSFWNTTGFQIALNEFRVCDPIYQYAGTLDFTGMLSDSSTPCLVDIKSGSIERWAGLQTAAYARCLPSKPLIRIGLQLRSDGTYRMKCFKERTDEQIFLSAVSLWWWKNFKQVEVKENGND